MEINSRFLEIIKKVGELDLVEEARSALTKDIKDLREKVFNTIIGSKEEEPKESDSVNHPKYYNSHPSGIECIDIIRHYNFDVGNAIKYLWRAGLKKEQGLSDTEKEIEDCKKAIWYINDHIRQLKNPSSTGNCL